MSFSRTIMLVLLTALCITLQVSALVGSIGNARMIIHSTIGPDNETVIERSILVKNVNDVAVNVTLKPVENLSDMTEMSISSLILQPNESRDVPFKIHVKKPGTYDGRIIVMFLPQDNSMQSPGVVLTSRIILDIVGEGWVEQPDVVAPATTTNQSNGTKPIAGQQGNISTTNASKEQGQGAKNQSLIIIGNATGTGSGESGEKQPNLLIGIGIMIVIIAVGLILFTWASGKR